MVTLVIGNTFEEAKNNNDYINFDENLHSFLQKNEDLYPYDLSKFTNLKMYGEIEILKNHELHEIKEVCDNMVQYTWGNEEVKGLTLFFISMLQLCEKAIEIEKGIVAISD